MEYTVKDILKIIRDYEVENGESFIDRYEGFIPVERFMLFSYERGKLTDEDYDKWVIDYNEGNYEAESVLSCYSNEDGDKGYEVFKWTEEQRAVGIDGYNEIYEESLLPVCEFLQDKKRIWNEILEDMHEVN